MVDSGSKAEGPSQSEESSKGISRREFLKIAGLVPVGLGLKLGEEGGKKEDLGFKKEIDELTDYGFEIYGRLAGGDNIPLGRQERRALDLAMLNIGDWIKNRDWVGILEKVTGTVAGTSGLALFLGWGVKKVAWGAKKLAERKLKAAEGKLKVAEEEGGDLADPEVKVKKQLELSDERAELSEGVNKKVDELIEKYKVKGIFKTSLTARALLGLVRAGQGSEELMIDDLTQKGVEGERRRAERNATINLMMDSGALTEIQWMDAYVVENYGMAEGEWTTQRLFLISKAVEWIEKNNRKVWEVMEKQGGWTGLSEEERMVIIVEEVKQEILRERFLIWPWVGEADLNREGIIELLIVDEELKQMVLDYELDPKDDPYKQEYKEE